MLDYEIIGYKVEYYRKGEWSSVTVSFCTEEEAVDFIKESRDKWLGYKLIKTQSAIIDF